jgi:hypothetical protein
MEAAVQGNEDERLAEVLRFLPVQDAPNTGHNELKMKRGRGRPRKVERMPTTSDLEYHAIMVEARQRFINDDPLVRAVENKANPAEVLFQVKASVAREASSLAFDQIEGQKRGRDTSQTSSRRIEALRKIAEIELKLRELESENVNFASEKFQKVFAFWVQKLSEVAQEVLPQEQVDMFLNRFASAMDNWEEEASALANNDK